MSYDFLVEITIAGVVHHDTQGFSLVDKWLFVTYDVLVLNGGQNSNFIQSILLLFLT